METLIELDKSLFLFLNGIHSSFGDWLMYWISSKWIWIPFYVFILIKLFGEVKRVYWICLLFLFGSVFLSDFTSTKGFKNNFKRYRPSHNLELKDKVHLVKESNGEFYKGGMYGFVSSHAANTFCVAVFVGLVFFRKSKKWLYGLLMWAGIVSYSRIYLGVHYPSDIICGAMLGAIIALISYYFYTLVSNKQQLA